MNIIYTCPKCGADLQDLCLTTYPPQYQKKCFSCGWVSDITREDEIRIPYPDHTPTIHGLGMDNINEACRCCSNHPSNGGSGICYCTLGLPKVMY